jgi:CRISPR-associated protein Cst2
MQMLNKTLGKCLTITFITKASYASLNGSDKESDNISSIKKIQGNDGKEYPYCSSQAIRRALREQLAVLGYDLSEGVKGLQKKGAATTQCNPTNYIDDDLFGFMLADAETKKRTSPIRVSPLIAQDPYRGELDFGTNYMSVKTGGDPNIFETEIHAGYYRGTILIELDRIGKKSEGDNYELNLSSEIKKSRVISLLDAIQNLWSVGRQSRFLSDISPKFVCAALLKVKNPIFLETLRVNHDDEINIDLLNNTLKDFDEIIIDKTFGERKGFFHKDNNEALAIGDSFKVMKNWMNDIFSE